MGLLYQRKFDVCPGGDYGLKLGYLSSHTLAIAAVRDDSAVLDLACGSGGVARELSRKGCRVTGIDKQDAAPSDFERFVCHDLDAGALPPEVGGYDFILALDCLEHLSAPEKLLAELRERCYGGAATVILTAPNIGFFSVRLALLAGQFNYGKQGILDLTHRRLFTFRSLRRMLEEEGYEIVKVRGIPAPFPKALGNNVLGRALLKVNQALIFLCRGLFAYQIYVEARFLPPVSRLLARTIEASERRSARQAE